MLDYSDSIKGIRAASKKYSSEKEDYESSFDSMKLALEEASNLLTSIRDGNEEEVETKLSEWQELNDTLRAIEIMDEEIEKSKAKQELMKAVLDTTTVILKIAAGIVL